MLVWVWDGGGGYALAAHGHESLVDNLPVGLRGRGGDSGHRSGSPFPAQGQSQGLQRKRRIEINKRQVNGDFGRLESLKIPHAFFIEAFLLSGVRQFLQRSTLRRVMMKAGA